MGGQRSGRERANYGIDGPNAVRNAAIASAMSLALGSVFFRKLRPLRPVLATAALNLGVCSFLAGLALVGGMVWSSKVGKLRARDRLIESLALRGDESVLDVGCGRGLLLIAAAKRLTTGRVVGVDIWSAKDQSGNRPEAALENARIERVAERVEVKDGDARRLPFEDGTFDVVLSSLVLHNIHDPNERRQAVREMVRVLNEDGRVAILDALHTGEYANVLRESGMADVERTEARFLFFSPSRMVLGRKPRTLRGDQSAPPD